MAMIYIVEDDENIREIEMFALKNAGYEVQGFECAAAFYARLKEKVPALVLLDIMLPDEDGLTIVKSSATPQRHENFRSSWQQQKRQRLTR